MLADLNSTKILVAVVVALKAAAVATVWDDDYSMVWLARLFFSRVNLAMLRDDWDVLERPQRLLRRLLWQLQAFDSLDLSLRSCLLRVDLEERRSFSLWVFCFYCVGFLLVLESPLHHHSNQDRIRREQVALEKKTLSRLAFWCQLLFFEEIIENLIL